MRRQSEHLSDYRAALEKLSGLGLVYPSFESRAEIAKTGGGAGGEWRPGRAIPTGRRSIPARQNRSRPRQRARLLESGAPYALRLDMEAARARAGDLDWIEHGEGPDGETGTVAARPQAWGDVILARKETPTSYHLSVVIDDALQGVTEVVRGQDLFWSTSVHRLLQHLLGLPQPCYRHHRLVLDAAGPKALEVVGGDRLARAARRRRDAGRHPPPGRPALIAEARPNTGEKSASGVTRRARPWHGGAGQGQGNHGAKTALTAHNAAAEETAAEKARSTRCRRQGAQARRQAGRARHGRGGARRVRA